jgi:hypothetical protein
MKHILLSNLKYKPIRNIVPLDGYVYDIGYGAWLSTNKNSLLISDNRFSGIASKKKDVETGEDQK